MESYEWNQYVASSCGHDLKMEVFMNTKIFVNLPVKDLKRAMDFFSRMGFGFNAQFTDENAACLVIGDDIYVMLLIEEFFKGFTKKPITDTAQSTESIIALTAGSREAVDEFYDKAIAAGGGHGYDPSDLGFMYSRSFADPDGHLWEMFWMDPAHIN
jgi:uncharacterized protein